jgi:hypothetical protein
MRIDGGGFDRGCASAIDQKICAFCRNSIVLQNKLAAKMLLGSSRVGLRV